MCCSSLVVVTEKITPMNKKGLTLMEIIISIMILSVTLVSLSNLFVSAQRWFWHNRSQYASSELGRNFLDPLHMDVRQDTWGTGGNILTPGVAPEVPITINGIVYTPDYTVTDVPVIDPLTGIVVDNLRRVRLRVNWNEPNL